MTNHSATSHLSARIALQTAVTRSAATIERRKPKTLSVDPGVAARCRWARAVLASTVGATAQDSRTQR
jgi:hypothetical protein